MQEIHAETMIEGKRQKNIIAVASGKGGVGKTWFAITLAHLFARSGRRVLLFDGDIGLANVDVQLGLTPKKDLGSVFYGRSRLGEVITPYEQGGFDIIAGRSGSALSPSCGESDGIMYGHVVEHMPPSP